LTLETSGLILVVALVLGIEHAFDPDHVIALTSIVCNIKSVKKSLFLGTIWGLGHSVTVLIAGVLVVALRVAIPPGVTQIFEIVAGLLLIALGLFVVRDLLHERHHLSSVDEASHSHSNVDHDDHTHENGGHGHVHGHSHEQKSLVSGIVQGLGGSAAIMLVTLSTVTSTLIGLVFIVVFCAGVIMGMVIFGAVIGGFLKYTMTNVNKVHRAILVVTASLGIGLGAFIAISAILFGSSIL
jgi:ABC-type nickel/cobalt efflux system permease component RcnA